MARPRFLASSTTTTQSSNGFDYEYYNEMTGAHGIIMMTAWMLMASIGLITARFYKPAWPKRTFLSVKIWFTIHRVCMGLTLLLDAAGFILVFVEADGYAGSPFEQGYQRAHPAIGIVVTALVILNPILAFCRCEPDNPKRPLFNWTHTYVGYIAYILALINIFFGLGFFHSFNRGLPLATLGWIMFSFVMFHIFSEAFLQTHRQLRQWQHDRRVKQAELNRRVVRNAALEAATVYTNQQTTEEFGGVHSLNKVSQGEPLPDYYNTDLAAAEVVEAVGDVFSRRDYHLMYAYFFIYAAVTFGLWLAMVIVMALNI